MTCPASRSSAPRSATRGRAGRSSARRTTRTRRSTSSPSAGTRASTTLEHGAIARWVDSSNYLRAVAQRDTFTGADARTLSIVQRVAGVDTTLISAPISTNWAINTYYCIRLDRVRVRPGARVGTRLVQDNDPRRRGSDKLGARDRRDARHRQARSLRHVDARPGREPVLRRFPGQHARRGADRRLQQPEPPGPPRRHAPAGQRVAPTPAGRPHTSAHGSSSRSARAACSSKPSATTSKPPRDANVTDALQIQVGWVPRGLAVPRS
jgi:hypothetical protein